jgi:hypothetical protein
MSVGLAFDYFLKKSRYCHHRSRNGRQTAISSHCFRNYKHRTRYTVLGNTLDSIAYEKAGIIKPNLVVIGEYTTETKTVFIKKAEEYNLKFILLQI